MRYDFFPSQMRFSTGGKIPALAPAIAETRAELVRLARKVARRCAEARRDAETKRTDDDGPAPAGAQGS